MDKIKFEDKINDFVSLNERGADLGKNKTYMQQFIFGIIQECHLQQIANKPSLSSIFSDNNIMKWSIEFSQDDIKTQAEFRVIAKFIRLCIEESAR